MKIPILFANYDPALQIQPDLSSRSNVDWAGDPIVLAFAASIVVLLVVAWAVFVRKPQRSIGLTPEEAAASIGSGKGSRRKSRHRYPTLAESGGLPPVKTKS